MNTIENQNTPNLAEHAWDKKTFAKRFAIVLAIPNLLLLAIIWHDPNIWTAANLMVFKMPFINGFVAIVTLLFVQAHSNRLKKETYSWSMRMAYAFPIFASIITLFLTSFIKLHGC